MSLIETDQFPFEWLSQLAERESWRKEFHRPIYHIHKWWAKRLGSVFRGILLGCVADEEGDLRSAFYETHSFDGLSVFDPFMGSGTTVGEAHKLGLISLGRDINPVAVEAVRVALGPARQLDVQRAFDDLSRGIGRKVSELYSSTDSQRRPGTVLYYFWVMQAACPHCRINVDLFSSFVVATNASPKRRHEVQFLCPACGDIFPGRQEQTPATCPACKHQFAPSRGPAHGARATCPHCQRAFAILDAVGGTRPTFRLYGKLVLTASGKKEYLRANEDDRRAYEECSKVLRTEVECGAITLPSLQLQDGYNTRQAMGYGFRSWRDFFNDRQLLALGWLHSAITQLPDSSTRDALLTLFSGVLEFNNMFASYKGEGTGAVRHMFAHHILKPERTPIEAHVWGTAKSSGSFLNLFSSRLLRALDYKLKPTEVNGKNGAGMVCSAPFSGEVRPWPGDPPYSPRAIYLSCGDSASTGLHDRSIDLVVTDPPFFDNVHYSELADFFFAWQQIGLGAAGDTTRSRAEVQDTDASAFAMKLQAVFTECHRVLKDKGLMVFTYHHSRDDGWKALADAVLGAGFVVVNCHPLRSEMTVAVPKSQTKEPIQFDMALVCRKADQSVSTPTVEQALVSADAKLQRLEDAGFQLSRNDRKVVVYGQVLTAMSKGHDVSKIWTYAEAAVAASSVSNDGIAVQDWQDSKEGQLSLAM